MYFASADARAAIAMSLEIALARVEVLAILARFKGK
jgi:hypothetical protein